MGASSHKVDVITLHPGLVVGPTIIKERNSSNDALARIILGQLPGLPNLLIPTVDVRDIAYAHYLAFIKPDLKYKRFIICQETMGFQQIGDILSAELRPLGYRVTTKRVGRCLLKMVSCCNQEVRIMLPLLDSNMQADNTLSKQHLGLEYKRDLSKCTIEMAYSLIDKGIIPDKRGTARR